MDFIVNILIVLFMLSLISLVFLLACRDASHFRGIDAASDAKLLTAFVNRLYFVVSTCSTIGYGDIAPVSVRGKVLTIVVIISVFTLIAKAFTNYIDTYNKNIKQYLRAVADPSRLQFWKGWGAVPPPTATTSAEQPPQPPANK